jgi:hypothetical protein
MALKMRTDLPFSEYACIRVEYVVSTYRYQFVNHKVQIRMHLRILETLQWDQSA